MNIPSAAIPRTPTAGAPQAGLGALLKPADQNAKGMPAKDMARIMDLAKRMSDAQLADVLAGKSMDIPQFAAMTEAMGRKRLRTAVQGAQAQQQLAKPSVKQQALADLQMSGLDQLPAPNMETVDMADGGIVAFNQGGRTAFQQDLIDMFGYSSAKDGENTEMSPFTKKVKRYFTEPRVEVPEPTDEQKAELEREKTRGIRPTAVPVATPAPAAAPAVATPAGGGAPTAGGTGISALMPSYEELQKRRSTDYLSKLEELPKKQRESIAELKRQGQGEALMNLAGALFSAPTMSQALAKGAPLVASTAAATRKDVRAVEDLANQYDFNLAKAREAAEQGDMALALQYTQLANTNRYQMGTLDVARQRNAILGEGNILPRVSTALANIDKQAAAEAKQKFPMLTKANQAAYDAYIKRRSMELKLANPLTKDYAYLGAGDLASSTPYNVVNSPRKGASVIDPLAEG